jgi:hypothetical protein
MLPSDCGGPAGALRPSTFHPFGLLIFGGGRQQSLAFLDFPSTFKNQRLSEKSTLETHLQSFVSR